MDLRQTIASQLEEFDASLTRMENDIKELSNSIKHLLLHMQYGPGYQSAKQDFEERVIVNKE